MILPVGTKVKTNLIEDYSIITGHNFNNKKYYVNVYLGNNIINKNLWIYDFQINKVIGPKEVKKPEDWM